MDCLEGLKALDDNSVDAVVTDPPYGLSFMGKDWDKALPDIEVFKECLRVLKPGRFACVMSAARSDLQSRMSILLEDAGFNIGFTPLYWTYASGFPKAGDTSKMVTKRLFKMGIPQHHLDEVGTGSKLGFQPKPAVEPILIAMKPLTEKSYINQVMADGGGVTWLNNCRIPYKSDNDFSFSHRENALNHKREVDNSVTGIMPSNKVKSNSLKGDINTGRFPANLIVSDDILNDGMERKVGDVKPYKMDDSKGFLKDSGYVRDYTRKGDSGSFSRYFDIDAWWEQQLKQLPNNIQKTFPYLIVPKASKTEKNKGCEMLEPSFVTNQNKYYENDYRKGDGEKTVKPTKNNHPTVKPLKLMSYLIQLTTQPGDTILDPYAGSGTTLISAKINNREYIGYELEPDYYNIACNRLEAYEYQPVLI